MEAVQQDGANTGKRVGGEICGGEVEAAAAEGEAAAPEFGIDFAVDREEGVAQRNLGQGLGEARAIAGCGGEFVDGTREGVAEAVEACDA